MTLNHLPESSLPPVKGDDGCHVPLDVNSWGSLRERERERERERKGKGGGGERI